MTEEEWWACDDPRAMLAAVAQLRTERKVRLLLTNGARAIWDRLPLPVFREAIEVAEQYVEGTAPTEALSEVKGRASMIGMPDRAKPEELEWWRGNLGTNDSPLFVVLAATTHPEMMPRIERTNAWADGARALRAHLPRLFREVFGNPFRPVAFSPEWRTHTAATLARQMYESRDFSAMPILADALQDAGCENEGILSHCRGDGPHVRGCWVVDLVLAK
jgi:hypothetical protein